MLREYPDQAAELTRPDPGVLLPEHSVHVHAVPLPRSLAGKRRAAKKYRDAIVLSPGSRPHDTGISPVRLITGRLASRTTIRPLGGLKRCVRSKPLSFGITFFIVPNGSGWLCGRNYSLVGRSSLPAGSRGDCPSPSPALYGGSSADTR
jgi:hypothetical protein